MLETISDKKLDSMKKDLFEKINNFAIEIPVSPLDALEGKANTPASDADDRIIQTQ